MTTFQFLSLETFLELLQSFQSICLFEIILDVCVVGFDRSHSYETFRKIEKK